MTIGRLCILCQRSLWLTLALPVAFTIPGFTAAGAQPQIVCNDRIGCSDQNQTVGHLKRGSTLHRHRSRSRSAYASVQVDANGNSAAIIGGRPAGCPHQYCGCGLRIHLGISDKRLNLAWNWVKLFPKTSAHAGAAAVRHGHVMLLESHVSGSVWIVRDYNSGGGLSRIHHRDVRGYVFVEPQHG
jgi:hypothetical protein